LQFWNLSRPISFDAYSLKLAVNPVPQATTQPNPTPPHRWSGHHALHCIACVRFALFCLLPGREPSQHPQPCCCFGTFCSELFFSLSSLSSPARMAHQQSSRGWSGASQANAGNRPTALPSRDPRGEERNGGLTWKNLAYIKLAHKKSKLTAIAMEWRYIFKKPKKKKLTGVTAHNPCI
jgi:hypothetical protein